MLLSKFCCNTQVSHDTAMNSIFRYLQGTNDKDLVVNPSNRIVSDCYVDAYFAKLWGHDNLQYPFLKSY